MRAKNSIMNLIYNFGFTFITMIMNFVSRTIFINTLGTTILGVNTIITNILNIINIMELGVSVAIRYSLYKPLAVNDKKTINEILILFKKIYKVAAVVVLFIGIAFIPFLHIIIDTNYVNYKLYYLIYLLNIVGLYFYNYKSILIGADQKEFILTRIKGVIKIIKVIIQIFILIKWKNYLLWVIIEVISNIVIVILINRRFDRNYNYVNFKSEITLNKLLKKYKVVIKQTKYVFFHNIGGMILTQTDSIVISTILGIKSVTIYSNYMMIISNLINIIAQCFSALSASIGNLVVKENKEKSYGIWVQLRCIELIMGAVISYCAYILFNPFISLWVGSELIVDKTIVLFFCINLYISLTRLTIANFKMSYGLYWDIFAPIIEGVINLTISIILGKKIGLLGVLIGTFVSNIIIVCIWIPYMTFKYGFKIKFKCYINKSIKLISLSIVPIVLVNNFINNIMLNIDINWRSFFCVATFIFILILGMEAIIFMVDENYRKVLSRLIKSIIRK